jgi:peptidoglycan/LPS O-acetylase OafA/YrhL
MRSEIPNHLKNLPGSAGIPKKRPVEHSFASLNLMRGLCAATVLFSHTADSISNGTPIVSFNFGSSAVDVFMLISGFLMMWHYCERQEFGEDWANPKTTLRFYIRRFFRIAPLYYTLLVLTYVFHGGLEHLASENRLVFHPTYVAGPYNPTTSAVTVGNVVSHFTFAFGFIPRFAQSTCMPDWSIGLEMQFYLFFPLLALLLVRSEFLVGSALLVILHAVSYQLFGVGVAATPKIFGLFPYTTLLPFKLDCFLVGMLLASGFYEKGNPTKRNFLLILALLVAGIYMKKFLLISFLFCLYETVLNFGTGMAMMDAQIMKLKTIMDHRLFKFMADTSYGVYLIHIPVLSVVIWLLSHAGSFAEWPAWFRLMGCLATMLLVVYSLAFIAFKWIESPGISLGRNILRRIGK